jgi:hypothetical protein
MAIMSAEQAIDYVSGLMLTHRGPNADGVAPSDEAIEALRAEILEAFPQKCPVVTVVARSQLDAVRIAQEHGCPAEELYSRGAAGEMQLQYDSFGAATSSYSIGGTLVAHLCGEYDLKEMAGPIEHAVRTVHAEIAGSIFLEGDGEPSVLIIVPLPTRERRDELKRLHCADGPAISYIDEDRWYWHGMAVPRDVIMRDQWSTSEIDELPNTEIRRALAERLGGAKTLDMMGATTIDERDGYKLVGVARVAKRYLVMTSPVLRDGTTPIYIESVSRNCETALGARKWRVTELSESECDENPALKYVMES